jgi:predicted MPP superfamily phosphohydrolase
MAYFSLVFLVVAPLHERGIAQPALGWLCGLSHLLEVPGRVVTDGVTRPIGHHLGTRAWMLSLLLNGVFYACAAALGCIAFRKPPPRDDGDGGGPPARRSRREFLRSAALGVSGAGAAVFSYSFFFEPRRIGVSRRTFPVRGLAPELDGIRIVQLTDIHLGPWISLGYVNRALEIANGLEPDLILLTGDYVHRSPAYIAPAVDALKALRARIGIVAVLGNHDWWEGGALVREAFRGTEIPLIDNSRMFVTTERRLVRDASSGLCLAGVGDLWEDVVSFRRALAGVPDDVPRILLSHNPDAAEEKELLRGGYRIDLMLSGHTHGGQVRLPVLGTPIVPSRFGQKYAEGLVAGPACPVFVCRGIGMTVLPVRFAVPPEIAVIELRRA